MSRLARLGVLAGTRLCVWVELARSGTGATGGTGIDIMRATPIQVHQMHVLSCIGPLGRHGHQTYCRVRHMNDICDGPLRQYSRPSTNLYSAKLQACTPSDKSSRVFTRNSMSRTDRSMPVGPGFHIPLRNISA